MQHLHMCLQPQLLTQCLKMLSDLQAPAQQQAEEEDEAAMPDKFPEGSTKTHSSFNLDARLQLDHFSAALSDRPSEVISYGMCAEVRRDMR